MKNTKDKTKIIYREKKVSGPLLRHKLKCTRLNFTLVRAMLKELPREKISKDKLSVFTLLGAKVDAANKIDRCCAKQDFHLLHFQECFFRRHKKMTGLFQWKLARFVAKRGLTNITRHFNSDMRRHWKIQHLTESLDKQEKDVQKEDLFNTLNRRYEERQYLLTRITNFFVK